METGTALALPEKTELATLFKADGGIDPIIARIESEVRSHAPDVSTKKGRDAIAALAYRVSRSKSALDAAGKDLVDDVKKQAAKVDAERKKMRDRLDALRDEARAPLDAWETAEAARVAGIRERLARIEAAPHRPLATAAEAADLIARIEAVAIDDSFAEFVADAAKAKDAALASLRQTYAGMAQREAEQAELARLRGEAAAREEADRLRREAEQAEAARIAAERAEAERAARIEREKQEAAEQAARQAEARAWEEAARAQREAEARAEAERRAAADREAALQRQIEDANRREEEAAQRERARIAAERMAEEQARRKREADQAHRALIAGEIAAALSLMAGNATPALIAEALIEGRIPYCKVVM